MSATYDLIMVAYPSADAGRSDFEALAKLVKDKTVRSEGVILVDHDEAGKPRVVETGDHLGRKGMGWGGGVGLLVGLFAPPLLASIVVGGAVGGLIGKFVKHREEQGFEGLGEQIPPGTAAIITIVDEDDLAAAERVITSPAKSVVPSK